MTGMKLENLKNKEFEITEDGLLKVVEKKKEGKFIPKEGECYWFVSNFRELKNDYIVSKYDEWLVNHQPVFRTKEEAEEYRHYLDALDKYKHEFSDEEWKNKNIKKCFVYFNYLSGSLEIDYYYVLKYPNCIYFKSEKDAEAFIKEAGEVNVKRFMFDVWD